jgi:hypothetical protein
MDLAHQCRIYGARQHRHQAHHRQGHVAHLAGLPAHGFEGLCELLHAKVLGPADLDRLAAHGRI